jgi:hypothetical protein
MSFFEMVAGALRSSPGCRLLLSIGKLVIGLLVASNIWSDASSDWIMVLAVVWFSALGTIKAVGYEQVSNIRLNRWSFALLAASRGCCLMGAYVLIGYAILLAKYGFLIAYYPSVESELLSSRPATHSATELWINFGLLIGGILGQMIGVWIENWREDRRLDTTTGTSD